MPAPHPETWLRNTPAGLYCVPGDFHIDPMRAVDRAVITHGHADHARAGHRRVLATPETVAIMQTRLGERCAESLQPLPLGERLALGDCRIWLAPAGHVLGSAQVVIEHAGARVVISGDYKRRADPTCVSFEPVACDVFVTEATFALPVYRHPDATREVDRLLRSMALLPERTHVLGAYSLGKAQRMLALIREAGDDRPIWLHPAAGKLCDTYRRFGVDLGRLRSAEEAEPADLAGGLVLAPPAALQERWGRAGLAPPVVAQASGWFGVRSRTRARETDLPLVVSDHADWPELTQTLQDVGAREIWVTHGDHQAFALWARNRDLRIRALSEIGADAAG